MDPKEAIGIARRGIYSLGGIEVFKKDGELLARPMNPSPEAKKIAEAYNYFLAKQQTLKADDGDWMWDVQP